MDIITGKYVVTCNHQGFIPKGAIAVENGKILEVGTLPDLVDRYPESQVENFGSGVILPGLVNAHCHIDRTGFYEKFAVDTGTSLSPTAWYLEGLQYLTKTSPENLAKKIEQSLKHFVQTGVTCVGTTSYFEGTHPIVKTSGLRGVVYNEILSGPDKQAQHRFEIALALSEKYAAGDTSRVAVGFAPYSAYVLSRNLLNIISRHAKDHKYPIQIHLAETFAEMEFFYESKGPIADQLFPAIGWEELPPPHKKTPVQHLSDINFFSSPTSIVGGLHLATQDFPLLRRHMARVIASPVGNRRLRFGVLPWGKLKEFGIPVGLGTELFGNTEGFNLWEEMKALLNGGADPAPSSEDIVKMATLGGARALTLEHKTGSLEKGKEADYLVLDLATEDTETLESLCEKIVLHGGPGQVRRVAVSGKSLRS